MINNGNGLSYEHFTDLADITNRDSLLQGVLLALISVPLALKSSMETV